MLEARAYAHHYERYGTSFADLEAARDALRGQVADYRGLEDRAPPVELLSRLSFSPPEKGARPPPAPP